ncbi:MFS general substrate transporter [Macrolepiota fuliginosa MF-IS2]|uniref:MFS general substrate transporter n=1 Tax=Macrolepiota fuliginosa MF-IS2 TaxID=1400762 RepID=A0A9P6BZ99_9AGAR|nr:MFS general substrate transporter [Macrolepiota fuliginosa MF-IS2]
MSLEDTKKPLTPGYDEKIEDVSSEEGDSRTPPVDPDRAAEEKALVRRLDKRILPIACLLYLFAYLDRSNLGNAKLQGLQDDVLGGDKTGMLFDWVNSVFFFSYIIFQVPATVVSKLFPPQVWMACAAIGWGVSSTLMASSFNFPGMMVTRIFLGIFESGFAPAIPLYFSFFYTKQEMGLRMAYWFGFAAVAGAFGGLVAFGIQHVNANIQNWRLLFIVEGIPPVMLGLITMFFLPSRPESTTLFNERERRLAVERMNRDSSGDTGATVNKAHIWMAFRDWRIYIGGVIYFGLNCALASTSAFLPTIIKTLGFNNASAQLLTVPPYLCAAVMLVLFCMASDRLQSRGIFMAITSFIGGLGYLLLLVTQNLHVRYFATFCIVGGTYTTIGTIIAWYAHNLGSETKKATGIPMFMAIGQCGSVLGSHLFPTPEGPRYIKGFAVSCALEFLAAVCSIILTISYRWDNARRDRLYGKPKPGAKVNTHELADMAPEFRYVP